MTRAWWTASTRVEPPVEFAGCVDVGGQLDVAQARGMTFKAKARVPEVARALSTVRGCSIARLVFAQHELIDEVLARHPEVVRELVFVCEWTCRHDVAERYHVCKAEITM